MFNQIIGKFRLQKNRKETGVNKRLILSTLIRKRSLEWRINQDKIREKVQGRRKKGDNMGVWKVVARYMGKTWCNYIRGSKSTKVNKFSKTLSMGIESMKNSIYCNHSSNNRNFGMSWCIRSGKAFLIAMG